MKSVAADDATNPPTPPGTNPSSMPIDSDAANDPTARIGPLGLDLVSALLLWPEPDERCFRLVARCLGEDANLDWETLRDELEREGWIEATATPGAFRVTAAHRPTLEQSLAGLGGPVAIEKALVAGQARTHDPGLLEDLALWAEATGAWQVLELFWIALSEASIELTPATLRVVRDVPTEARKAHPILSWASGAATAMLAGTPHGRNNALMDRLLFDSALIHGDWSLHEETDTAVFAGTFRLIGQRRMPTTGATSGLDVAWTTKQEVDAFIERRTAEGHGPSRIAHSVFRAFSARLAVLRADLPAAIQEAHLAQLLSEWEPVTVLARGVEALARGIAFDSPLSTTEEEVSSGPLSELAVLGLTGMGAAFQVLAAGFSALVRLDRAELDRALSRVTAAAADVAGLWSVRAALVGFREFAWGSPADGLNDLLAAIANRPPMTNEQNEPLGRAIMGRARILLLAKTGALAAAQTALDELPVGFRAAPAARTALWAGHNGEAVRLAEAGLLETGLRPADRSRLATIAAAATLLQPPPTPASQDRATQIVEHLVDTRTLWPLAALPTSARHALVDAYLAAHDADDPAVRDLLERISGLNDASSASGAVRLTHRELQLLPLLATDDSIPEIAKTLQVSVHTVRTQVATLREKFHAGTRAELIRLAAMMGYVPARLPGNPPPTR